MSYLAKNYNRKKISFVRGKGSYLYTSSGTKYLDFVQGIAVNCLGHANPKLIKTIKNSHKSSEKEDWIALAECIRSDQVPASDVAKFFSNKRFYGWYKRKYLRY